MRFPAFTKWDLMGLPNYLDEIETVLGEKFDSVSILRLL